MENLIEKYFLAPIRIEQGYNIVNTVVYALLTVGLLYLIFKIFKKYKIKIDYRLFISSIPFILLGSALRVFVDLSLIQRNFWTVSPGIYLFISGIFLTTFSISYLLNKKKYHIFSASFGVILLILEFVLFARSIVLENLTIFFGTVLTIILLALAFYFVFLKLNWKWITDKFAFSAFFAHLLDAVVTSMILTFVGGWEKHPLPRFFIERFGAFSFLPLKLFVIIPAIYVISTELKDKELRNFLLIAIAVLGLAEGIRNIISLII
jgi:uncharacterized membrane protein